MVSTNGSKQERALRVKMLWRAFRPKGDMTTFYSQNAIRNSNEPALKARFLR